MERLHIKSELTGVVWKISVNRGENLQAEDIVMVIESMKMEIPITSSRAGRVVEVLVAEGETIQEGQTLAVIEH